VHSLETDRVGLEGCGDWNRVFEVEKKAMEAADRIIPVSRYTQECATKYYGIPESRFFPVHNAINPEDTFRLDNRSGEKLVLFLGRVTFQKGPEFMVETAWKLLQVYPNVLFFVAGVGDMLEKLKALVLERKIDHKFVFAGFLSQSNVKKVLAQADVYFMPSVSEPFGLSALEAAQFEVPCVISKQSGVAEVLQDMWLAIKNLLIPYLKLVMQLTIRSFSIKIISILFSIEIIKIPDNIIKTLHISLLFLTKKP
jgi:glycosyltransferase involved in cell wall biosynthesis